MDKPATQLELFAVAARLDNRIDKVEQDMAGFRNEMNSRFDQVMKEFERAKVLELV